MPLIAVRRYSLVFSSVVEQLDADALLLAVQLVNRDILHQFARAVSCHVVRGGEDLASDAIGSRFELVQLCV